MNIEKKVMTVPEVMEALNLGRSATYEAIRRGDIPVLKIGRRLLIPIKGLDKLLEEGSAKAKP